MKLVDASNPILRQQAVPVERFDDSLRNLIADMRRTMLEHGGIGLAAPQVGSNLRVFVTENGVYVNPKLTVLGPARTADEGCLSLPGIQVPVSRYSCATITAQDEFGNPFNEIGSGLLARVWQHECDHLQGILITDHQSKS